MQTRCIRVTRLSAFDYEQIKPSAQERIVSTPVYESRLAACDTDAWVDHAWRHLRAAGHAPHARHHLVLLIHESQCRALYWLQRNAIS